MATRDRREREKAELRTRILDAAREQFAIRGYEAVSMRKIAEAIEYSPTAIYDYFRDKESLFREVCAEDFASLARVFRKLDAVDDPVERIARTGHAYIDFALRHPNHYRLMFMAGTRERGEPAAAGAAAGPQGTEERKLRTRGNPDEDAYAYLRGRVAEALAAGRFRGGMGDAELITQTLWAGVHGVASLQIAKGDDPWIDWRPVRERAHTMVDVLLRGMVKRETKRGTKPGT